MFSRLRPASPQQLTAKKLYGAVVAGARTPALYRDCGVPDTPAGRYEMLVLHTFLLAERIRSIPSSDALERHLVEAFVTDFDDNMREMGVGDIVVHRKVKKATAGLFERSLDYRAALETGNAAALAIQLAEHIPELKSQPDRAQQLATVIVARAAALKAAPQSSVTSGEIAFQPFEPS